MLTELANVADTICDECVRAVYGALPMLGESSAVQTKHDNPADVVTVVDKAVQDAITRTLRSLRPGDGLIAEEQDQSTMGTSGVVWVCDPIDGTASLVHGGGSWCISIAAASLDGESLVGIVADVQRSETFRAVKGQGSTLNGKPIRVSDTRKLEEAIIGTDFGHDRTQRIAQAERLGRVASRCRATRNVGSTVLHICWVAAGRLDGLYQTTTQWWDVAASGLCVLEAGGILSDLDGGAPQVDAFVAATPGIHEELVAATADSAAAPVSRGEAR